MLAPFMGHEESCSSIYRHCKLLARPAGRKWLPWPRLGEWGQGVGNWDVSSLDSEVGWCGYFQIRTM